VSVEIVEVGDDNGDRQCDGEYPGDDAQRPDELAPDADRRDVAVADRRHRDDGPPERARDRRELAVLLAGLGVVRRRAEDDHRDQQEEEEHAELAETGLDCHTEDSQALQATSASRTCKHIGVKRKQLPNIEFSQYKNCFINRCLFKYR